VRGYSRRHSTVVFDSVELTNIAVRLISGTALLEAADIVSSGLYRLYGDIAEVLDGKLQTDSSLTIKREDDRSLRAAVYMNKVRFP